MTRTRLRLVVCLVVAAACSDGSGPSTGGTGEFWDAGTGRYRMVHMTGGSPPYRYIDPANHVGTDLDSLVLDLRVDGTYGIVLYPDGVAHRPSYRGYWAGSGSELALASLDQDGRNTTGTIGAQLSIADVQAIMPDLTWSGIGIGPGVPVTIDFERTRDEPITIGYARSRLITGDGVSGLVVTADGTVLASGSPCPCLFHATMPFTLPPAQWSLFYTVRDIAVAPTSGSVFLVQDRPSIAVYDVATGTSVGAVWLPDQPLRVGQGGGRLFATVHMNTGPDLIYRIDPDARTTLAHATVPSYSQGLVVSDDGSRVYVTNGSSLVEYDGETLAQLRTLPIASSGIGLALSADGGTIYLSHDGATLEAWDLATGTRTATFAVPGNVFDIGRQPGTGHVFVTSSPPWGIRGGSVTRVDPANPSDIQTYQTDGIPRRIAFSASGTALIANQGGWIDELR
jgi:DNA-binding beta-propeller fold protein YncE